MSGLLSPETNSPNTAGNREPGLGPLSGWTGLGCRGLKNPNQKPGILKETSRTDRQETPKTVHQWHSTSAMGP